MQPAINSIHERMAQGGDWMQFRDEIASLHKSATTEVEYVTLLEAFHNLVLVGEHSYDAEQWAKILPITRGEYKNFLNMESMENGSINPALLDRITLREVEAGRLDPDDDFRAFALAGGTVLGDSAGYNIHHCRPGNMLTYGTILGSLSALLLQTIGQSSLWAIAVGFLAGWVLNEHESRKIKAEVQANRIQRQG